MTAAELAQLRLLVDAPRLATEAKRPTPACADAFVYELSVGDLAARYSDCSPAADFPVTSAIVRLLTDTTPL